MALLNTWASQQDQATLSPLDRLLNNYIQQGNAPLSYLLRGDPQGLWKNLKTPKPVNMTQDMTNAALNLNPVMGLIGATAYHGSPYLFDKFNINKVGTGEGAQAYGHGMYFAENPNVAQQYTTAGLSTKAPNRETEFIIRAKEATANDEAAKQFLQKRLASASDDVKPYLQKALNNFDSFKAGNVYKVDIPDQDIPKMLNWDKPIKEQKSIMQALKKASKQKDEFANNILKYDLVDEPTLLGKDLYDKLNYQFGENQSLSSDYLSKFGLKGIKYLDEGSRGTGKGTSNFVVFDPKEVKILEKGLLGK